MSKPASKPKPKQTPTSSTFKGFININLSEDDKQMIKNTTLTPEQLTDLIDGFIDDGYKFTFSYDDYSHCYQCIGTHKESDHADFGVLLSGRGSTTLKAFKQWWYIVVNMIGESNWSDWLKPNTRYEIDD